MQDSQFTERYKRQLQLKGFGPQAQAALGAAKVLVVGAGGLGVPALQYLVAMGIGAIGIIDNDTVSLSNLHRQVLYSTADIGKLKVEVAAVKLADMSPAVNITTYAYRLSVENAIDIIREYDLVLDATDNIESRYLINDACVILGKPLVYGAVHHYEGHISVFNFGYGPTYRCLYPKAPASHEIPDCNMAGVLGVVPGIIGSQQALQAVKIITGIGKTLSGYLQVHDFLNDRQHSIRLKTNPLNKRITTLQASYSLDSARPMKPEQLQEWYQSNKKFLLLDVREADEFMAGHLPGAKNIPLSELGDTTVATNRGMPTVVYCQKGSRSAKAVLILQQAQSGQEIMSLEGGMEAWPYNIAHS